MKVSSLLFLCLVLTLGFDSTTDAASISKRAEGKSTQSENGSVVEPLPTTDDVANVTSFVFRTLGQFEPIRLISEALGLPLDMLLSPILDALGTILMPVRQLLSKSLSSLAPVLEDILIQLGRLLNELLDNLADTLDPASSSSSSTASSTSLSTPSTLSSFSSNVHRRQRRCYANIFPLEMANFLRVSTGSTTSANNGTDLLSSIFNFLNCDASTSDALPSANEIGMDPARSLKAIICFIFNRIINVGEGVMDNMIPKLVESLKNVNATGIIPPPLSIWIHTLIMIYEMRNALTNGG